jgi:SAM-dependent methyltransferase
MAGPVGAGSPPILPTVIPRRGRHRLARAVRRWIWSPDKWERLSTVADRVGPVASVVDVGGRGRELSLLLPRSTTCVSANVEDPCDVRVPHDALPFPDGAFSGATSCDVLEHVPPDGREGHVAELLRVARERVVICFPAWSPEKEAAERRLHRALAELGVRFDFLDEHLEHGLPRGDDVVAAVRAAAPDARVEVTYQQGIEEGDRMLLDAAEAYRRRRVRPLLHFLRAWVRRPGPRFSAVATPTSSRAYLVVSRGVEPAPG